MRLLGSMEPWLASTFLPLLLLTCLPVGTASQMLKPVFTVHLEIGLENLTVQVKWCNSECLEKENQTSTVILGENCMNFTSSSLCTAHTGICVSGVFITTPNSTDAGNQTNTVFLGENCRNFTNSSLCTACTGICVCGVFITRPNLTDTGDSTQAAYLSCGCAGPQTDVTGKIWTGELMSGEVTEGNQAAPVTGTEDLTYANLNFEKKGTGSASSNVIYTEIKPLQQKQSGGDGSAACTEVDVSPKEEGK
ncbi:uncharacterized protein LOC135279555 isoform X6 [Passer domesticus]|uniref:uncharacterized protein LOC135279555 isoform X6 n=1 Tax=Passer domesticus TaxID=48849 RepID=UPI0030FE1A7A